MKHEHVSPKKCRNTDCRISSPSLMYLPPQKLLFSEMFAPRSVGEQELLCGEEWVPPPARCLLHGSDGDSTHDRDNSHLHPWTLSCQCAWLGQSLHGEPGMEGIWAMNWGGTWEMAEGESQERKGTFLGWGNTSDLSQLYQRVINQQSAGLRFGNQSIPAQKQPGEMNLGPT